MRSTAATSTPQQSRAGVLLDLNKDRRAPFPILATGLAQSRHPALGVLDQGFRASKIMSLARCEHQLDRIAQGVDERMNLGGQSAAQSADRLRTVFSRASAVLMSAHDGGIEHHVFVVGVACQQLENSLENAALELKCGVPAGAFYGTINKFDRWAQHTGNEKGIHIWHRRQLDLGQPKEGIR